MEHGNPAAKIEEISFGATMMMATVNQRLVECRSALDGGDFGLALEVAQSLVEKLAHLAHAENGLGRLAKGYIVRASEIEVGMRLWEVGTVAAIEECPNCDDPLCGNRLVKTDDEHELLVFGNIEILAVRQPA